MGLEKLSPQEYQFGELSNPWFEVKQITENTWAIREPYHDEDVLSFLVKGTEGSILFDTGMGLADIRKILPTVVEPRVLLTHSHWDHIGGISQFSDVEILDHPYEATRLQRGWQADEIVGYTEVSFKIPLPINFSPSKFNIPGRSLFSTFKDGEIIEHAGIKVKVIHTPGHTPGSVCFFLEEQGVLITGDTLYPGPEYLHLSESNVADYYQSLKKLILSVEDRLKLIFPGHNAFIAQPDLLLRHFQAMRGMLVPDSIQEGEDEFGKYIKQIYGDFSLMFPPR